MVNENANVERSENNGEKCRIFRESLMTPFAILV